MSEALAKKLLLIGWNAADWQMVHPLIDSGRMPHLKRLVDFGTIGNLQTLPPVLPPILWRLSPPASAPTFTASTALSSPRTTAPLCGPLPAARGNARRCGTSWRSRAIAVRR